MAHRKSTRKSTKRGTRKASRKRTRKGTKKQTRSTQRLTDIEKYVLASGVLNKNMDNPLVAPYNPLYKGHNFKTNKLDRRASTTALYPQLPKLNELKKMPSASDIRSFQKTFREK
jgi:hypothetical protein